MEKYLSITQDPASWQLDNKSLTDERLDSSYYSPGYLDERNELESSGHEVVDFNSICVKLNCGATPKNVEYASNGLPLIRTSNVRPNKYIPDGVERVSGMQVEPDSNVAILPGDVLYTMSGSVGYAAVYPEGHEIASCSNTIARGRIAYGSDCDPYFVAAFLNSRLGFSQSMRLVSGGVLGHVMPNPVKKLRIVKPSREIQKSIGNKFRKVERLSHLSRLSWEKATKLVERGIGHSSTPPTLESIRHSDLRGSGYDCQSVSPAVMYASVGDEIAAQYFHPRRIAAQLVAAGSDKFDLLRNIAIRKSRSQESNGSPNQFVGLDAIDSTIGYLKSTNIGNYDGETGCSSFGCNDILFSRLRPYLNKVAIWPTDWPDGSGSGELLIYTATEVDPFYLFFVLKSGLVLNQVIDVTSGSTHPRVDADVVDTVRVPRLDESTEQEIGRFVRRSHEMLYEAQRLVPQAMADVENIVSGKVSEKDLHVENALVLDWLENNPYRDTI